MASHVSLFALAFRKLRANSHLKTLLPPPRERPFSSPFALIFLTFVLQGPFRAGALDHEEGTEQQFVHHFLMCVQKFTIFGFIDLYDYKPFESFFFFFGSKCEK